MRPARSLSNFYNARQTIGATFGKKGRNGTAPARAAAPLLSFNLGRQSKKMAIFFRKLCAHVARTFVAFALCTFVVDGAEVKLAWSASPSLNVAAYRVYYGPTPGAYASFVQVAAPATSAVIGNLPDGITHYLAAKAVDTAGVESDYSNEASFVSSAISNTPPTLTAPPGMIIRQNAGPQTVALSGITSGNAAEAQTLNVTATSNNPKVIPHPVVNYTSPNSAGTLVFTPAQNAIGWSVITVTVDDGGSTNNVTARTFWVFINNPPTLNPISNIVINEDSGARTVALAGISSGATNEVQPLTVTATSGNPAFIPNPTVNYTSPGTTATLTFAPAPNVFGAAHITVKVSDGQYGNKLITQTFLVTVNPVNDAPTLNAISNITLDSSAGARSVPISGISSGPPNENQVAIVTAVSSNPLLVASGVSYANPSSTGSLMLTPTVNQTGTATITVTVNDRQLVNNSVTRRFSVTVNSLPKISGVTAAALDARTMRVSWNTDRNASCTLGYGPTSTVNQSSASTSGTSHSVTLSNLTPATLYYLQIRATTSGGTATALTTASTEARQIMQWAAENGTLSGSVQVFSSTGTENGKYLASSAPNATGSALFNLNLAKGPNFRMWARVKTSPGGGTFALSVDGTPDQSLFVGDTGATNTWHWAPVVMNDATRTNLFALAAQAGPHTLTTKGGLSAWWDEFAISNDPLWQPILPTTRPILVAARDSAEVATLGWNDASETATSAWVEYSKDGINYQWCATVPSSQKQVFITNLLPQTYYFRVFSYNSLDRTDYSNVAAALY
jgi:hypothetical protein